MNNDLISREALKEFINEVCFSKEWAKYRADKGTRGQIECILTYIDNAPTVYPICEDKACKYRANERPQGEIIRCKDCKYRIEEFRQDRRMKNGGYTVKACKHFADLAGYWCWGGQDNQFCSEAERKENDDEHTDDP